jgi:hypothetical protein
MSMAIFQSSSREALKPHVHVGQDHCPWCDQPISHGKFEEITRRIEAKEREQHAEVTARLKEHFANERAALEAKAKLALEGERAAAANAAAQLTRDAEARVVLARHEAAQAAEAATLAKLADMNCKLVEAEEAKMTALQQKAALEEAQEAALKQRLDELQDAAEKAKTAAIQAVQIQTFEEKQKLQAKVQDLQRQLESKSAHELGEGSEIDLFEQLRGAFEGDRIWRVAKGVNGADVIHEVIHNGRVCGKIIYDSKNRNAWQNEFATKLRADRLAESADHAVLSSNKFPKGTQQLHMQDGVIIASPARVLALAEILRRHILQTHELRVSGEQREQKTTSLYAFITSDRCKQLLEAVAGQAGKMIELDEVEQKAHRRTWDQRSRLIRSVQKTHDDLCFEIDRIIGTAQAEDEPL